MPTSFPRDTGIGSVGSHPSPAAVWGVLIHTPSLASRVGLLVQTPVQQGGSRLLGLSGLLSSCMAWDDFSKPEISSSAGWR